MGKKTTFEDAKELFKNVGGILLTINFDKGQYTNIDFICICGQLDTKNYRKTPRCNYDNHTKLIKEKEERYSKLQLITPETPKKFS